MVGNEKGGAGKSTVSMHIATALARLGHSVGAIDLDLRQRSLGRYIENRYRHLEKIGADLASPRLLDLPEVDREALGENENEYDQRIGRAVSILERDCEFIVIDCPGAHTRLAQVAHSLADTLVTPLNDSFVDFDLLARIDNDGEKILGSQIETGVDTESGKDIVINLQFKDAKTGPDGHKCRAMVLMQYHAQMIIKENDVQLSF